MGRFTVRLPDTLHATLEERAQLEGVSLNQFVVYALTQQVTPAYTVQVVPAQTVREDRERYDSLLARLGPPDRQAATEFLAQRDDSPPEDPDDAELVARFRDRFSGRESAPVTPEKGQ